jgi:DNA-binding response OmpR family regulator
MRILLVEDEPAVARMIARGLTGHGHQVVVAATGEEGVRAVETEPLDLVLLDIILPGQDGHEVLAGIRRLRRDLPVIMLTARDDLGSKLSALDGGAEDYITKPFEFEELLARIRVLARRAEQQQAAAIEFGDLRIELHPPRVWRGVEPVALARREFALLEYFARNPGRLLSRRQILAAVWEHESEGETRVVDVYVGYLRTKLDRPGEPSLFTTVRGSGYRFDPPPTPATATQEPAGVRAGPEFPSGGSQSASAEPRKGVRTVPKRRVRDRSGRRVATGSDLQTRPRR